MAQHAVLGDRSLFPHLEPRFYLNHAAISPVSAPVHAAVEACTSLAARHGTGAFPQWSEVAHAARTEFSKLIGAQPADVAFVANTSAGVTSIALCFPWRNGDRAVVFDGEFPANVTPWQRAAHLHGIELITLPARAFFEDDDSGLDRLESVLKHGARLVAVSVVQFQTGLRMPLRDISDLCHRYGAELFVDGIQGCGAVPVDVINDGIDYLACGSHKWLMGTFGCGLLWVSPHRVNALRPHLASWLSHTDPVRFLFEGAGHLRYDRPLQHSVAIFEGGAGNVAGQAALAASIPLLLELGIPRIFAHIDAYLVQLERALSTRGFHSLRQRDPSRRSGILSVTPPSGVDLVVFAREAGARGASLSTPDGHIRFAPHWPNNTTEIDDLIDVIDECVHLSMAP